MKNCGTPGTRAETGLAKWFATVASEKAASDAVPESMAPAAAPTSIRLRRFFRNCKAAVIYEGARGFYHHSLQADCLLGYRSTAPTNCELPAYAMEVMNA